MVFIGDPDLPNLRRAPPRERARSADHPTLSHRTHMIRVDLHPHCVVCGRVERQHGTKTRERFGKRNGCPAVEHSVGLPRAVVDGHPGLEKVVTELEILDPDMPDQIARGAGVRGFNRWITEPNRHGHILPRR